MRSLLCASLIAWLSACTPTLTSTCASDSDCKSGRCVEGACLLDAVTLASCTNKVRDGDETDTDCGGSCGRCAAGAACGRASDCASRACESNRCAAPAACLNGLRDPGEDAIDCGGTCAPCGTPCTRAEDCPSGVCDDAKHVCRVPEACENHARDPGETDVDCGGTLCAKCANGLACVAGGDCQTGFCDTDARCSTPPPPPPCQNQKFDTGEIGIDCGGACPACTAACAGPADCPGGRCGAALVCEAIPPCENAALDAGESDVDCGGPTCPACALDRSCARASDCASSFCSAANKCAVSPCTNGQFDAGEIGIDCGGTCPACTAACAAPTDCPGGRCGAALVCEAIPPCENGVQDAGETDLDCGGPTCGPCAEGRACVAARDCATNVCGAGRCVPSCVVAGCTGVELCDTNTGLCAPPTCRSDGDCTTGFCRRDTGTCDLWPCLAPATRTLTQRFTNDAMAGCAAQVAWSTRASLCAPGLHVCTAREWAARQLAAAPAAIYWVDDALAAQVDAGTSICVAAPAPPTCGDGVCARGENCSTCPGDCGACPTTCGDGTCSGTETCTNCAADCGACPSTCGDGTCNGDESCSSCASDCGACPSACAPDAPLRVCGGRRGTISGGTLAGTPVTFDDAGNVCGMNFDCSLDGAAGLSIGGCDDLGANLAGVLCCR